MTPVQELPLVSPVLFDGLPRDLWILGGADGALALLLVPRGEEPGMDKFLTTLEQMIRCGAPVVFLAKVVKQYAPSVPVLIATEPERVQ